MTTPVSLVVVNHDRVRTLALLLKGLEYQRHPNFEIIVVSNLDPEDRPSSSLPIRWIPFREANISAARNQGIRAAAGDIVAFCDDDSVPEFGWLEALSAPFSDPEVGAAGGYVRGRNGVSFQWQTIHLDRWGRDHRGTEACSCPRIFPPDTQRCLKTVGTNSAFRRSALAEIGGFNEAYRFYHDEADVNMRLARAGWSSAIVPAAEVHHGYAEGPHRTRNRVPKSLFEIGASEVVFCRTHAGEADLAGHRNRVRRHQRRRLDQLYLKGLIDVAALKTLLHSLDAGFEEGAARVERLVRIDPPSAEFARVAQSTGGRELVVTGPMQGRAKGRTAARRAAEAGQEVTLIEVEATHRNLHVHFTEHGFWRHRVGLLGLSERDQPRPPASAKARIEAEIRRVSAQRGLEPILTSAQLRQLRGRPKSR
ncbi:MAG: glycosyltransferase [Pseudomonadota bacterium]